jgi:transcriptional regulator GlxA family with amidase domain
MLAEPTAGLTVAKVAVAAGFTHLGRFAEEYRSQFGELPSQTLARGRARSRRGPIA